MPMKMASKQRLRFLTQIYQRALSNRPISIRPCCSLARTRSHDNSHSTIYKYRSNTNRAPWVYNIPRCYSTNPEPSVCWQCNKPLNLTVDRFFCEYCSVIQPVADNSPNYFECLDQPVSYAIDVQKMQNIYRNILTELHPDKFASKTQIERDYSDAQSSLVNRAYNVLSRPLSRAEYLLKLNNCPLEETDQVSDPEFLMKMMEINEKIADCDKNADHKKLQDLYHDADENMAEAISQAAKAFDQGDYVKAREATVKMRFFDRLINNVNKQMGFDS